VGEAGSAEVVDLRRRLLPIVPEDDAREERSTFRRQHRRAVDERPPQLVGEPRQRRPAIGRPPRRDHEGASDVPPGEELAARSADGAEAPVDGDALAGQHRRQDARGVAGSGRRDATSVRESQLDPQ
jgi:hypothetical protein